VGIRLNVPEVQPVGVGRHVTAGRLATGPISESNSQRVGGGGAGGGVDQTGRFRTKEKLKIQHQ
jgi:hypothetical protein